MTYNKSFFLNGYLSIPKSDFSLLKIKLKLMFFNTKFSKIKKTMYML